VCECVNRLYIIKSVFKLHKKLTKKARNKQKKTKVKIKQTSDGSILLLATPVVNGDSEPGQEILVVHHPRVMEVIALPQPAANVLYLFIRTFVL